MVSYRQISTIFAKYSGSAGTIGLAFLDFHDVEWQAPQCCESEEHAAKVWISAYSLVLWVGSLSCSYCADLADSSASPVERGG